MDGRVLFGAHKDGGNAAGGPDASGTVRAPAELARYIDHTLLKPDSGPAGLDRLCQEAVTHQFHSVCVNSCWIGYVAQKLRGTGVAVASTVGFPLGAMASGAKASETAEAVRAGASEVDMVINVGKLKAGDLRYVEDDIRAVRRAARRGVILKVIIETALLTEEEKVRACELSMKAGADFVKTCTGFSGGGATVEDVALMRRVVGRSLGVKASGGIRTFEDALAMVNAGATRLGTSAGVAIVSGGKAGGAS